MVVHIILEASTKRGHTRKKASYTDVETKIRCFRCIRNGRIRSYWKRPQKARGQWVSKETNHLSSSERRSNFPQGSRSDTGGSSANTLAMFGQKMNNRRTAGIRTDHGKIVNSTIPITIDSGVNEHVFDNHELFQKVEPVATVTFHLADGSGETARYRGKADVYIFGKNLVLRRVYFIPCLQINILSCSALDAKRIRKTVSRTMCTSWDKDDRNTRIGSLIKCKTEGLYIGNVIHPHQQSNSAVILNLGAREIMKITEWGTEIWHGRLTQAGEMVVNHIIEKWNYYMKRVSIVQFNKTVRAVYAQRIPSLRIKANRSKTKEQLQCTPIYVVHSNMPCF